MTPEELHARRLRIKALNDKLITIGQPMLIMHGDHVTDEMIAKAERALAEHGARVDRIDSAQKPGSPSALERAAEMGTKGVLTRIVSTIAAKRQSAAAQVAEIAADVERAEAVQSRYDGLVDAHKRAQVELELARQLHASHVQALAKYESAEFAVECWRRPSGPNDGQPDRVFDVYQTRHVLAAAVRDWPKIEPVLIGRVKALEAEMREIEREFA